MHCYLCFEAIVKETTWATLFQTSVEKICETCRSQFEKLDVNNVHCPKCMKPQKERKLCLDCLSWNERLGEDPLEKNISIYSYNDFMKETMAKFKYRGDYELVFIWEDDIQQALKKFNQQDLIIVPIPLSDERYNERGFNQAEALAKLTNHPIQKILKRKHSEKQSKKSKAERIFSQNPFHLIGHAPKNVLIVDDIFTTGTTIRQAAKTLKENSSQNVYSLTLIRS